MFSDRFRGGMNMASASMRDMYSRTSEKLGLSSFQDSELTEEEVRRNIKNYRSTSVGGLYNEGNTCFINSVIQSLASCKAVGEFVERFAEQDSTFSYQLLQLFKVLNAINKDQHTHSTGVLMDHIGGSSRRWKRLDQEDAQEYFQQLLMALEKDLKKPEQEQEKEEQKSDQKPKLLTPFDGLSAVRVGCCECKHTEGVRRGVLSSLDLSLDANRAEIDLYDLIADYCTMETISGVECYSCTLLAYQEKLKETLNIVEPALKSGVQKRIDDITEALSDRVIKDESYANLRPSSFRVTSAKTKQTMFASPLPKVLMIHINRSVFDMRTGYIRKVAVPVKFPTRLNLRPYTTDPDSKANLNPETSMEPTKEPLLQYELRATVIHYGSANFGHYVCYRKFHGLWWRISDETVNLTTEAQVLNAQGVFMLFYEQVSGDGELEAVVLSDANEEPEAEAEAEPELEAKAGAEPELEAEVEVEAEAEAEAAALAAHI